MTDLKPVSAVLHVPSLPVKGETLDLGEHIVIPSCDFQMQAIANVELNIKADNLNAECDILAEDVDTLTKELEETFEELQKIKAESAKEIKEAKDKANSNVFNFRKVETRAIKAEKQLDQALSVNKRRSEKIAELQKIIKALEGSVKVAVKQLEDAKKSYERKYIDPSHPTLRIEYKDKQGESRLVIIQYTDHQIHVHDPASAYLLSSQPLFSEVDYVPRFIGYPFTAMLDQHHLVRDRIEHGINQLAYDYRVAKGKVLTADIRGEVKVGTRKKLWDAGIMFASELEDPATIEKVKGLPGIGKKTLEALLAAAKKACKK